MANKMFFVGLVFLITLAVLGFASGEFGGTVIGFFMVMCTVAMVAGQIISYRKGPW